MNYLLITINEKNTNDLLVSRFLNWALIQNINKIEN